MRKIRLVLLLAGAVFFVGCTQSYSVTRDFDLTIPDSDTHIPPSPQPPSPSSEDADRLDNDTEVSDSDDSVVSFLDKEAEQICKRGFTDCKSQIVFPKPYASYQECLDQYPKPYAAFAEFCPNLNPVKARTCLSCLPTLSCDQFINDITLDAPAYYCLSCGELCISTNSLVKASAMKMASLYCRNVFTCSADHRSEYATQIFTATGSIDVCTSELTVFFQKRIIEKSIKEGEEQITIFVNCAQTLDCDEFWETPYLNGAPGLKELCPPGDLVPCIGTCQ